MKRLILALAVAVMAIGAAAMTKSNLNIKQPTDLKVLANLPPVGGELPDADTYSKLSKMMNTGRQVSINTISDLYGTWMMSYSNWDGGTGYSSEYCTLTIKAGLTSGQVIISGWWLGLANDITATVNWSAKTITIAPQLLINVDGYTTANLVNYDNPSGVITGKIYTGGIQFLGVKWGVQLTDGTGYYAVGTNSMCKKCNGKMTYSFEGTTYTDDVLMGQNGTTVAKLSIYNFFGCGTMMEIDMHSDSTFQIEPVVLYTDDSSDNYYCYGTDGNSLWKITGTGTEYRLDFGTKWSLCSPTTNQWMGEISNTAIYYTDGTLFKYPPAVPEAIALNLTNADNPTLVIGETLQLTATITPANADQSVTWTSSDETVATVDANGLVTATGPAGQTVTITATSVANPNLSASVKITITDGTSGSGVFADLNNDGVVDIDDVNIVISVILGKYQP